uniref:Uncharacterized protein n=1 Tax=Lepeophtheirus salmonis TaxID=72036 RepID=A0A0K2U967_LEPSM
MYAEGMYINYNKANSVCGSRLKYRHEYSSSLSLASTSSSSSSKEISSRNDQRRASYGSTTKKSM